MLLVRLRVSVRVLRVRFVRVRVGRVRVSG